MGEPVLDPTPTESQVRETIANFESAADRLFMTDIVFTSRSAQLPGERSEVVCRGASCTQELGLGYTSTSTVADWTTLPAEATETTIRPGTPAYGVDTAELSFRRSVRGEGYDTYTDYTILGGWIRKNYFGVIFSELGGTVGGNLNRGEAIHAFSVGTESGTNPLSSGSATWQGLMVGRDDAAPTRSVNGQATLTFDFADNTLDVNFTNITGPRTYASMTWSNVPVQGGLFNDGADSNSLSGSFYGDAHEEVGGIFERNQIIGAFGAVRN
ncbi:MAG: transferrin-binding protein-like solute binding protein [Nitrospira sp.]|nr:transferrin-binding protein-like solute binding protein [Nitrospira sp.]